MVRLLFQGKAARSNQRLLDPGCGDGAFIGGVLRWSAVSGTPYPRITGMEIDRKLSLTAETRFQGVEDVSVVRADFLKTQYRERFDYVIGNPPYVSILHLDEPEKTEYRSRFRTATGRFDLYMLFFERALDSLAPGGRLVFVTPEKFTYVDSASSLRSLLAAYSIQTLELLPEDSFPNLVTYPLITVVEKTNDRRATLIVDRKGAEKKVHLPGGGASWGPSLNGYRPSATQPSSSGDVLSLICDRISCGIATGSDKVFVFKRDEIPSDWMEFAWPTVSGRDLDLSKRLIETRSVMLIPYDIDGMLIPLARLGAFGRYLEQPRIAASLLKRTCASRKPWHAFHETPTLSKILRPKILCKDIAREPSFWIDRTGATVPRHSTYYIVPRQESMLEPLCEYLNSKQAGDWLFENCQRAANGFVRLQSNVLKRLPIPAEFASISLDASKPTEVLHHPISEAPVLELCA